MEEVAFKTQVFEGPLDLLLHLIAKNKVDIYDIPIVEITRQYFEYMEAWQAADIEFSSAFLVMASQLLYIKSKMLLPKHEEEEAEAEDPRKELADRLAQYQLYKQSAAYLAGEQFHSKYVFFKEAEALKLPNYVSKPLSLPVTRLISAFMTVLERQEERRQPQVADFEKVVGEKPVSVLSRAKAIVSRLRRGGKVRFEAFFAGAKSRSEKVATFLAMLELLKANRLFVIDENDQLYCTFETVETGGEAHEE